MEARIFDRRGRRNWDDDTRKAEDRRMRDRRKADRRVAERRQGLPWPDNSTRNDNRKAERRALERRSGTRRDGPRRQPKSYTEAQVIDFVDTGAETYCLVSAEATFGTAVGKMVASGTGFLIVSDEAGKPIGALSEGDCLGRLAEHGGNILLENVSSVLPEEFILCQPGDLLQDAVRVLIKNNIVHLPVIEDKTVVGMLNSQTLLRFFSGIGT